jgi:hypothetical protein
VNVKVLVWVLASAATVGILLGARHVLRLTHHGGDDVRAVTGEAPPVPRPFVVPVKPQSHRGQGDPAPTQCPIRFQDVIDQSGITFEHRDGSSGRHFTPETMSAGMATFDYDGDGVIDVYFPNGAALPGVTYDPPPRHALYKNLGDWRFEDVSARAGIVCPAFGLGIAIGDYDNDGFPDIYLDNFGPNILYHNNGDGTFTDVTNLAGVPGTVRGGHLAKKVGAGACFLDTTGRGCLDLFAGNYVEIELDTYVTPMKGKYPFYPTPLVYAPIPNTLYRNSGDGTFVDASVASGVAACAGRCMGVTACDFDADGDTDLFICNDVMQNFLLRNDGRGNFKQVGLVAGVAMGPNAEMVANMGVDAGDYNNDGWLDFFVTNYDGQYPLLLRNLTDGMFINDTLPANAGHSCHPLVKWGCGFVDFDNDTHRDVLIANGHTDDNIGFAEPGVQYRCHNVLLWNTGRERFVDVSIPCGLRTLPPHSSRGTAFDDLDNDGDIDAVIFNSRERPTLLRNLLREQGHQGHWLQIELRGVKSNRDGVGSHVRVVAGNLKLIDEVHSSRGYQGHWGSRLHFGLGSHAHVDRVEVRWLGGGTQVLEDIAADQRLTITEAVHPQGPADSDTGNQAHAAPH